VALRRAVLHNSLSSLGVTKLDVLDGLDTLRICTGYRIDGEVQEQPPLLPHRFSECEPVYETHPGWQEPTSGITEFAKLPENARRYLARMEQLADVPIDIVSTGPTAPRPSCSAIPSTDSPHEPATMKPYESPWMDDDLRMLREAVSRFVETEMLPHEPRWRAQHHVDRSTWRQVGEAGFLLMDVPSEYGGGGGDFRHEAVLYEECNRRGISGFGQGVHSIAAHYVLNYGTRAEAALAAAHGSGELIGAIAMTEPGAGSDLKGIRTRAVRDGNEYVINGSKIFITNGSIATILMLVVRTDPGDRSRGLSILMVETENLPGYRVGRVLDKMA